MLAANLIASVLVFAAQNAADITVTKSAGAIVLGVKAPEGSHLNFEGPWKLELSGSLPLAQTTYGLAQMDQAKESFTLPLTRPASAGESADYTLTYFYCATDKSWCKRAQAKGHLE